MLKYENNTEGNAKYDIKHWLKITLHVFHQNFHLRLVSYKQDAWGLKYEK